MNTINMDTTKRLADSAGTVISAHEICKIDDAVKTSSGLYTVLFGINTKSNIYLYTDKTHWL